MSSVLSVSHISSSPAAWSWLQPNVPPACQLCPPTFTCPWRIALLLGLFKELWLGTTCPVSHTGARTKGLSLGPSNQDSVWLPGCGVSLSRRVFNYLHNDGELQWERSKKRPFQKSSAPSAAAGILRFTSLVCQTLPPSALSSNSKIFSVHCILE